MAKAFPGDCPYYKIKDLAGEEVGETFYEHKLQLTIKGNNVYQIETNLKKRNRGGGYKFLVKWSRYPDKCNSWITEKDLLNYG